MQLIKVDVKNYRCLTNVSIPFHKLTVLIGENDSGKSTVLDLLDLILNERQPEDNDFYYVSNSQGDLERRAEEIEAILIFNHIAVRQFHRILLHKMGAFI